MSQILSFNRQNQTYNFLKKELIYWFYEEIEGSLMAQLIMKYIFSEKDDKYFEIATNFFKQLATSKGKNVKFIFDQYNNLQLNNTSNKFFEFLYSLADNRIFVSTNTDQNIMEYKESSVAREPTLILSESQNLIPKEEMIKIIKKLYRNQDVDLAGSILEKTKRNLSLMFLFYKHCANKKIMGQSVLDFFLEYENFSRDYTKYHKQKHHKWQDHMKQANSERFEQTKELMIFLDLDFAYNDQISESLLDHRYVFSKDTFFIKSINPLISTMLRKLYWTPSMLEKFLNQYGQVLTGSTFGGMYEFYMISKIKTVAHDHILKLPTRKGKTISFTHKRISTVTYGGGGKRFEKITYARDNGNKMVFYETTQENFPLFDCVVHTENTAYMINFRKDADSLTESFSKYYELYTKQTKEQLSNQKTFKFFFFKII